MTIDLSRQDYSVQSMTKAQLWAVMVYIILASLDYGLGVSSVLETPRRVFKSVLETVTRTVLEIHFKPTSCFYAGLA